MAVESWPRTALENIAVLHHLLSVLWEAMMAGDSQKAVVVMGMTSTCLRISGTAGSWQLGKGENNQRWMVRRQLGSQCSLGWCNCTPITRMPWVGGWWRKGISWQPWLAGGCLRAASHLLLCSNQVPKSLLHPSWMSWSLRSGRQRCRLCLARHGVGGLSPAELKRTIHDTLQYGLL